MTDISRQCGDPTLSLSSLIRRNSAGGVIRWFDGQNIYFSANARAAIRKACDLLGVKQGDEILVPSYNGGSEIDPLLNCGASVVPYRVHRTCEIDLEDIEGRITARTKALYIIHYFGYPEPQIAAAKSLCARRGLYLIEDCALALFSELGGRKVGTFGDVAVFSFYKYFPTIGGGALIVNNPALPSDIRLSNPAPARFVWKALARAALQASLGKALSDRATRSARSLLAKREPLGKAAGTGDSGGLRNALPEMPCDNYFDPAFKDARISRLTARALGSFSISQSIDARRRSYLSYLDALRDRAGIECLIPSLPEGMCPLAFPIVVADRDRVCDQLNALGISVTPWWKGYHRMLDWGAFPDARELKEKVLALPLHQYLDQRHVAHICRQVIGLVEQPSP